MSDGEWRQVVQYGRMPRARTGWIGAWDAVVAAVTGRPRHTVMTDVTMSVWVKGDQEVKLLLTGGQVESKS